MTVNPATSCCQLHLKVKESGETVDTTYDAVAKDTHLHRDESTYGPRFIILEKAGFRGLEDPW